MQEVLAVPPPVLIPAATVVVFRHAGDGPPELLMVQRSKTLRFAAGAAVFPGGKVDPQDRDLAARLMPDNDLELAAARIAGIRETLEETGLAIGLRQPVSAEQASAARALLLDQGSLGPVLDAFGWELAPDKLIHFAHWCTPTQRAFDTHFFLTDVGSGAIELAVDETECTHLFWITAADALTRADAGEIRVIFPTRRNLERLALSGSFAQAVSQAARHRVERIIPAMVERDGTVWLEIPGNLGYPVLCQPLADAQRG